MVTTASTWRRSRFNHWSMITCLIIIINRSSNVQYCHHHPFHHHHHKCLGSDDGHYQYHVHCPHCSCMINDHHHQVLIRPDDKECLDGWMSSAISMSPSPDQMSGCFCGMVEPPPERRPGISFSTSYEHLLEYHHDYKSRRGLKKMLVLCICICICICMCICICIYICEFNIKNDRPGDDGTLRSV